MKQQWLQWSEKFSQRSSREKWLITICGLALISLVAFTSFVEPVLLKSQATSKQISNVKSTNQRLEADLLVATAKLKRDPDKELNIELQRLMAESQVLSEELSEIINNLVTPSQMTILLEQVLSGSKGLQLVSLESMPAEAVVGDGAMNNNYYLHPVRMELTGDYFAIVRYLEALEAMPMKYYWRSFSYVVEEYPSARLVFEVYTLGTRQEFIGG